MRLSVWKDDPGYRNWDGRRYDVFLDGQKQRGVFVADEEAGEIISARYKADGSLIIEGEEVATQTLRGEVVIRLQ